MNDLKNAVKNAFTYLVANPENPESLSNVKFYMDQEGYNDSMLIDGWQMAYEVDENTSDTIFLAPLYGWSECL